MSSRFPVLLLLIAVILFASACGQSHADERYVLVTANINVPYWQTARAGLNDAARPLKARAEFVGPDTYDPKAEQEAFQKAVREKPAGILISSANPELMRADIDAAIAQGIPVITIDSDSPKSKRLTFIGTNNYQAGIMGGEVAARALKGKGNVVVFTMPGQANLDERLAGYRSVLDKHPGIKITRVVDMKGDPRIVFDTTQQIVDKKERVDGFICLEAQGGKEVATVLAQSKATGKVVVAMDTDADTLDWIRKGVINATIAQKPYTMAYFGLKQLDDLHHHPPRSLSIDWSEDTFSPIPAFIDTGATLIDKSNVDAFAEAQRQAGAGGR